QRRWALATHLVGCPCTPSSSRDVRARAVRRLEHSSFAVRHIENRTSSRSTRVGDLAMEISLLTFGDSIMWGQGLNLADKFTTRTFNRLATYVANQGISVESYANEHSGATIWPVGDSDSKPSMWREVPVSQASIVKQVDG